MATKPPSGGVRPGNLPAARRQPPSGGVRPGRVPPRGPSGGVRPGVPKGPPQPKKPKGVAPVPNQKRVPYRDQSYYNQVGSEQFKRNTALNSYAAQGQQAEIGYGFKTDIATNPYSRAALLQKNYDTAQKGTMNSMAAGGQLYSGAHSNAREGNRGSYDQNYDALRKGYDDELARISAGKGAAKADYRLAVAGADQDAIDRAAKIRPTASFSPAKRGKRGKKGKK